MPRSMMVPVLVATLGVSACAQAPTSAAVEPVPSTTPPAEARCEAGKALPVIGQSPSAEAVEEARVQAGAETVRVLRHGQMVTKEYRSGRLNLVLDASDRIASVNCS